jgi:hypothetical protein
MATMNAWAAPIADKTLLHRSLANNNFERSRRATAYQAQIDGATDALGTEQAHDFANAINGLAVPSAHDIADEHSGAYGRSVWIKAHDQNAAPAAQRLRSVGRMFMFHGSETGAEIATKHMAPRQQLIDGAVDGRAGDGKRAASRSENRHPDNASLRVDEGAALGCRAKGEVKANEAIDRAATHTMPSAAGDGDDAERSERTALIISDREGDLTGA